MARSIYIHNFDTGRRGNDSQYRDDGGLLEHSKQQQTDGYLAGCQAKDM